MSMHNQTDSRTLSLILCSVVAASAVTSTTTADALDLAGRTVYYDTTGTVQTGLFEAEYVSIDVYVILPGERPRLLEVSDCAFESNNPAIEFLHDDVSSGTWKPSASLDIPGFANPLIDSFLTLGWQAPPLNTTVLLGPDTDSSDYINGSDVAWTNSFPANGQGDADPDAFFKEVMIGRFVLSAEQYRSCTRFEIDARVTYDDRLGNPDVEAEVSGFFGLLGCVPDCPADLDFNDRVDGGDLASLLGSWGAPGGDADLDGNGMVDGTDLAYLLGAWGVCP